MAIAAEEYSLANVLIVSATNSDDALAGFSNSVSPNRIGTVDRRARRGFGSAHRQWHCRGVEHIRHQLLRDLLLRNLRSRFGNVDVGADRRRSRCPRQVEAPGEDRL